jgi:hypothetical protein
MMSARQWLIYSHEVNDAATACETLSWEKCPICGALAAVGRQPGSTDVAVECTAGCAVPVDLVAAFEAAGAR